VYGERVMPEGTAIGEHIEGDALGADRATPRVGIAISVVDPSIGLARSSALPDDRRCSRSRSSAAS